MVSSKRSGDHISNSGSVMTTHGVHASLYRVSGTQRRVGRCSEFRCGESSVLCLDAGVFSWFRERGYLAQETEVDQ